MRAFKGNTNSTGQVPVFVGTSYDVVVKVHEHIDDIMKMGTILEQTADFLFFHFDVAWGDEGRTTFTGLDSYDRPMLIIEEPMVYVNGERVPNNQLTVLGDGTILELATAVAPGDQVHIAAFGFNADGTIYFHPLLAIDRLLGILAEIEAMRDQMLGHLGSVTSLVDTHRDEIDAFNQTLTESMTVVDGQLLEVENIFTRAQATWINAGFESTKPTEKGIPFGWEGTGDNLTSLGTLAGSTTNVPLDSDYKSTRSFGSTTQALGKWWYISKLFKVSGADRIVCHYRYWAPSFLANPGPSALEAGFLDNNDTFLEVVSFDSDGAELETKRSISYSQSYWETEGVKPVNAEWSSVEHAPILLHADAAYAEVRLVFANGTGTTTSLVNYRTTGTSGNHGGLVDDVNFFSANGRSLIEISPSLLGSAVHAKTAIINSQSSAGYADEAGAHVIAATQQVVLAQTAASQAALIQTTVAEASESATAASSTATNQSLLAATANLEAGERARGNYIGKSTFEDGELGRWGPQPGTLSVTAVPEPHPLGRTKALRQTGSVSFYQPLNGGGWFEEDLFGRVMELSAWIYNATDGSAEVGIEAVRASDNSTAYYFEMIAGGGSASWIELSERLPAIPDVTKKWRPVLRILGSGQCYWTDLVAYDVTSLGLVEGVAAAVVAQLDVAEAYVTEAEEHALASSTSAIAAETSKANAVVAAGSAATSATGAAGSASSALNYLNLSAQVVASGGSVIENVFLDNTIWAVHAGTGTATSVPNEKYPSGRTWTLTNDATGNIGLYLANSRFKGAVGAKAYVVEVEFQLLSGTLDGLQVLMDWSNSGGFRARAIAFLKSDTNTHTTIGVMQKARVILTRPENITPANFTGHYFWIMSNWTAPKVAKSIKIHSCFIRLASAEELGDGLIQAKLTNEYSTTADMNGAIASAVTDLEASIDGTIGAAVTVQATAIAELENNASAGYLVKTQAGGAVSLFEMVSASDGVTPPSSFIKLDADELLLLGSVKMDLLSVGLGKNMLDNTNWRAGTLGWIKNSSDVVGTDTEFSIRPAGGSYASPVMATGMLHQPTATTTGYAEIECRPLVTAAGDLAKGFAVTAGDVLEASVQLTTIRNLTELRIKYFDAAGAVLGNSGVLGSQTNTVGAVDDPDSWPRIGGRHTVPAGAKSATIHIRKYGTNSSTSSTTYIHKPQVCLSNINATELARYTSDGTTIIDGGQIITDSVDANKIKAGSVLAGSVLVDGRELSAATTSDKTIDVMNTLWLRQNGSSIGTGDAIGGVANVITGAQSLRIYNNGVSRWRSPDKIVFDPNRLYRISFKLRSTTTGTAGTIYLGVQGYDAAGAPVGGVWAVASNMDQALVGTTMSDYVGYIKGVDIASARNGGTVNNPSVMIDSTRRISGEVLANYDLATGGATIVIDSFTVEALSEESAELVNRGTTKINPGQILVAGATTLSDWRGGGDTTKINGGAIESDSILTNSLKVGQRGITLTGIQFEHNKPASNQVSWTAGFVRYTNDAGVASSAAISASNATWTSGILYIYWVKAATSFSTTTSQATACGTDNVILATYEGGTKLDADFGRTIIDGTGIKTNTITANQLRTDEAIITGTAQLANAVVQTANIVDANITTLKINGFAITDDEEHGYATSQSGGGRLAAAVTYATAPVTTVNPNTRISVLAVIDAGLANGYGDHDVWLEYDGEQMGVARSTSAIFESQIILSGFKTIAAAQTKNVRIRHQMDAGIVFNRASIIVSQRKR